MSNEKPGTAGQKPATSKAKSRPKSAHKQNPGVSAIASPTDESTNSPVPQNVHIVNLREPANDRVTLNQITHIFALTAGAVMLGVAIANFSSVVRILRYQ